MSATSRWSVESPVHGQVEAERVLVGGQSTHLYAGRYELSEC